jgi:hypothetical protein
MLAGAGFGANVILAVLMVVVVCGMMLGNRGMGVELGAGDPRGAVGLGRSFYGALGVCFAGFAFRAWRRQQGATSAESGLNRAGCCSA